MRITNIEAYTPIEPDDVGLDQFMSAVHSSAAKAEHHSKPNDMNQDSQQTAQLFMESLKQRQSSMQDRMSQ